MKNRRESESQVEEIGVVIRARGVTVVVRLHSSTRPSGPKRTKRISQPVSFINGVPSMADRDSRFRDSIPFLIRVHVRQVQNGGKNGLVPMLLRPPLRRHRRPVFRFTVTTDYTSLKQKPSSVVMLRCVLAASGNAA